MNRSRLSAWVGPALLAGAVLEIYLLVVVGRAIGVPLLLVLLIAQAVAGFLLVRRAGSRARRALEDALQGEPLPGGAVFDAVALLVGGILIAAPGLLNTLLGAVLVLPFTRRWARRGLEWFLARAAVRQGVRIPGRGDSNIIEGEVVDEQTPGDSSPKAPRAAIDQVYDGEVIEGRVID